MMQTKSIISCLLLLLLSDTLVAQTTGNIRGMRQRAASAKMEPFGSEPRRRKLQRYNKMSNGRYWKQQQQMRYPKKYPNKNWHGPKNPYKMANNNYNMKQYQMKQYYHPPQNMRSRHPKQTREPTAAPTPPPTCLTAGKFLNRCPPRAVFDYFKMFFLIRLCPLPLPFSRDFVCRSKQPNIRHVQYCDRI